MIVIMSFWDRYPRILGPISNRCGTDIQVLGPISNDLGPISKSLGPISKRLKGSNKPAIDIRFCIVLSSAQKPCKKKRG